MDVTSRWYYASRGARLGAHFLDALVMVGPIGGAFLLTTVDDGLGGIALIVASLFSGVYYFFADAMEDGQSFGKRALDMAVIDAKTGKPCSAGQSFARNLLLYVLGPIDWLFILGDRHQRLGDKLAGTIVVQVPDGRAGHSFGREDIGHAGSV